MAKVTWTIQAMEDIADIAEFHDLNSPRYASFLVDAFLAAEEQLSRFPNSGRIVPETNLTNIRELIIHAHRVIYVVVDAENVSILAVRHSQRPFNV